jgi:lipopolysaccharide export LptBFGC system permease protein LptF
MAGGGHATGEAVLGVTLSFTILAVIAACLRLLTRFFISKAAGADDAFVAVSTVSIPGTISLGTPLTHTDPHSCTDCCSLWSR